MQLAIGANDDDNEVVKLQNFVLQICIDFIFRVKQAAQQKKMFTLHQNAKKRKKKHFAGTFQCQNPKSDQSVEAEELELKESIK